MLGKSLRASWFVLTIINTIKLQPAFLSEEKKNLKNKESEKATNMEMITV